jgi:hypothetical protein
MLPGSKQVAEAEIGDLDFLFAAQSDHFTWSHGGSFDKAAESDEP